MFGQIEARVHGDDVIFAIALLCMAIGATSCHDFELRVFIVSGSRTIKYSVSAIWTKCSDLCVRVTR
jgi:hypothetical protein